jgi:hypothetical protein
VQTGLFGSEQGAEMSGNKHISQTFGSMKDSKEENHYNIVGMSLMQCRMEMQ